MELPEILAELKTLPLPIYWEMLPIVCATHVGYKDEELVNEEYKKAGYKEIKLIHETVIAIGPGANMAERARPRTIIREKDKKPRFAFSHGFIGMTYDDYEPL